MNKLLKRVARLGSSLSGGGFSGDAVIYGLGVAVSRAASLIMLPIYTRFLTPADYGIVELLQMTADVLAIILAQGVAAGVFRFFFAAKDATERSAVVWGGIAIAVVGRAFGAAGVVVFARPIASILLDDPAHATLIYMVAASFMVQEFTSVPMLVLQLRRQAGAFVAVSLGRLILQLAFNILFVVFLLMGPAGVILSSLLTSVVSGGFLSAWLVRLIPPRLDRDMVRRLWRFGVPLRVSSLGSFVTTYSDRFFLKASAGLAQVGLYGVAYKFGFALVSIAVSPYMKAWNPRRFEAAEGVRHEGASRYNQEFRALTILTLAVAVAEALGVRPLLRVLSDESFWGAAQFVPVLLLSQVFAVWGLVVDFGIQMSERTKYNTIAVWAGTCTAVILYAVLIPRWGIWGAAVATLVSQFVRFALQYVFGQMLWRIPYEWGPHGRALAYGAAVVMVNEALIGHTRSLLTQIAAATALFALFAVGLWWGGVLQPEDRDWVLARVPFLRLSEGEA